MAQAQKKYVCAFCARAFTRSEHKQRHERSHTNEKPFHCLHCTSSFVRRDLLQRHCRTVHNTNLNPNLLPTNKSLNNPTTNAIELTTTTSDNNSSTSASSSNGDEFQTVPMRNSFSFDSQDQLHQQQQQQQGQQVQQGQVQGQGQFSTSSFDSFTMTPSTSTTSEIIQMMPSASISSPSNNNNSTTAITNNQSKRRKKSSEDGSNRLALKEHHDLIHLLSIAKKLSNLLTNYDPVILSNCTSPSINEIFLIGYSHLIHNSKLFTNFDKILKDLFYYLSTSYLTSQRVSPPSPQQINGSSDHFNNFKIGISYTILSLGYIIDKKPSKGLKFFKKSWNLLIKKLIPQYNNNNNLLDQIEILHNLFLLTYVYLQFNLESFNINEVESLENDQQGQDNDDQVYINNEVILNYLNDISFIIISNLKDVSNSAIISNNENLIDNNMNLFWNIYILLSTYLIDQPPPKLYSLFLERSIKNNEILINIMQKFCKSFINIEDEQLKMIIVSTLSNELKDHKLQNNRITIYSNKNTLHNAIILINKSINNHNHISHSHNHVDVTSKSDEATKLFELFKKNLVVNSPLKFHELFNNYIFIPKNYYNWQLISLTLQEINQTSINLSILNTIKSSNDDFKEFELLIKDKFFDYRSNTININNNLLIVSFPIIFFNNYLNLSNLIDLTKLNNLQFINLNVLIIEWYLIMNKVLIMLFTDDMTNFDDNYILQTLIYLLLDNKSCLLKKLNIQDANTNKNQSSFDIIDNVEELSFNQKWFWILRLKLDSIFENWLNLIRDTKSNTNSNFNNNLRGFKMNLNKLLNEYVITEGLTFKEEDNNQNQQQEQQQSLHQQPLHQQPLHQPPIQQPPIQQPPIQQPRSHSHHQEYIQTTSYIPLQNSISNNSTNSFMNFDNQQQQHQQLYKRSNSITLGMLAQTIIADESSHNSTNTNSPNTKNQPRIYNPQQQLQQQQSVQPIQQYTSYSAYPPPPPILSNSMMMNSGGSNSTNTNTKVDVLLPPIRHEERMTK